jgi:hypothetical protein
MTEFGACGLVGVVGEKAAGDENVVGLGLSGDRDDDRASLGSGFSGDPPLNIALRSDIDDVRLRPAGRGGGGILLSTGERMEGEGSGCVGEV